jgi:hypothetical protein
MMTKGWYVCKKCNEIIALGTEHKCLAIGTKHVLI